MSEYIVNLDGELGMALAVACAGAGFAREKIVRCRDCRFYKSGDDGRWCLRSISMKSNHSDGFCAWGERKD